MFGEPSLELLLLCHWKSWRPRRDLNPCYRRESGKPNRKRKKLQEPGALDGRSKSRKTQINVSPTCPRPLVRNYLPITHQSRYVLAPTIIPRTRGGRTRSLLLDHKKSNLIARNGYYGFRQLSYISLGCAIGI